MSDRDELLYENMRHLDFLKIDHFRTELAKRTAERDEARREICERNARENWIVGDPYGKGFVINTPEREARLRGWDCFDAKEVQT